MPRPSLRDRLARPAPQGREALYGNPTPAPVDGIPYTVDVKDEAARWEDSHQRVTFYCPRPMLQAIEDEMARSGRSKSQVIVDAVKTITDAR